MAPDPTSADCARRPAPSPSSGLTDRRTVSILRACEIVGVSRRTVYNWLAAGKLEYVRTPGGSVRIFVDQLFRDPNHPDRPAPPTHGLG